MEDLEDKNNISIGKLGEDLACGYLVDKGYRILQRNYRKPWGEIDIIGKAKDGTLVFFEVKALAGRGDTGLAPEDNVTAAKLIKLRRTCQAFVAKNPDLVNEKKGWRIDLVAIEILNSDVAELTKENCRIRYYENI